MAEIVPRLKKRYREEIVPALMKRFGYRNVMEVPRLEKIVVNIGLGEGKDDAKALDSASQDIATITGQRPVITRAKKSIAGFKLRAGHPIGLKATVRGGSRPIPSMGEGTTPWVWRNSWSGRR